MPPEPPDSILPTAALARLSIEPDEARELAADFAVILASFQAALERSGPAEDGAPGPCEHPPPLRADVPRPSDRAADIRAAAPELCDGHFRVPPAIGDAE